MSDIVVDKFLDRVPSRGYKCFDFVREVWLDAFGEDVGDQLSTLAEALSTRRLIPSEMKNVRKLDQPVDPCFIVMQRKRCVPHIGLWFKGRVLHLAHASAQYVTLNEASRQFTKVSYYL